MVSFYGTSNNCGLSNNRQSKQPKPCNKGIARIALEPHSATLQPVQYILLQQIPEYRADPSQSTLQLLCQSLSQVLGYSKLRKVYRRSWHLRLHSIGHDCFWCRTASGLSRSPQVVIFLPKIKGIVDKNRIQLAQFVRFEYFHHL
jgi:hypothetical protein